MSIFNIPDLIQLNRDDFDLSVENGLYLNKQSKHYNKLKSNLILLMLYSSSCPHCVNKEDLLKCMNDNSKKLNTFNVAIAECNNNSSNSQLGRIFNLQFFPSFYYVLIKDDDKINFKQIDTDSDDNIIYYFNELLKNK